MDESSLIAASLRGEVRAFNRLVEAYQDLAFNVAYRMLSDRDAAADVTQDAFIAAYRALPQFHGGSFRSWLLRIVTNGCYDFLRARQRHQQSSLESMLETGDDLGLSTEPSQSPESLALSREMLGAIAKGLAKLPPDQRAAVVLSDVQGFSYEEIAEVMECSLGTVKSRLSRGRGRLREILLAERELLPGRFRLLHGGEMT
ncbi:MAG: sigma-70 family RNA polymerase sigma factor [Chloroflexi bacterium]|nr:sigma-70 family RNA polymerase sigma factor [Chloroflexota bacterium]MCL5110531.1 sigma-70 family RNA polymerase sigma factor [Chloroflexota bacterium]